MTPPLEVTVVRPNIGWRWALVQIATSVTYILIAAYVVMILAPISIYPLGPSYKQCLVTIVLVSYLLPSGNSYRAWTKAPR